MNLQLAIKEMFEGNEVEVYQTEDGSPVMIIDDLAKSLGYADKSGVEKIVSRNEYLTDIEFSTTDNLSVVEGGRNVTRERRIFNEDGIYEITMLSTKPKAKEFRAFVRKLIKALRKGEVTLSQSTNENLLIQKKRAAAMEINARVRQSKVLEGMVSKFGSRLSDTSIQSLLSHTTYLLTGKELIPQLKIRERHYTATEIGEEIGVNKNKIGRTANKHELKQEAYGMWVKFKSRYSDKQFEAFHYNELGKERLKGLLG